MIGVPNLQPNSTALRSAADYLGWTKFISCNKLIVHATKFLLCDAFIQDNFLKGNDL